MLIERRLIAAVLTLAALGQPGWVIAQQDGRLPPHVAAQPEENLKEKIKAAEKGREDLLRRIETDNAKARSREQERDIRLRKLSGSVCSGCDSRSSSSVRKVRRWKSGHPDADGLGRSDPSLAGGVEVE